METHSLEEFQAEAARFAAGLSAATRQPAGATVVALSGDLGAGKTTFVQAAAKAFAIEEPVKSPTFIIMQAFMIEPAVRGFSRLVHIDAYRLKEAHELEVLGWRELIADPEALIFIEWPEQVPGVLPAGAMRVRLEGEGDIRRITYGS